MRPWKAARASGTEAPASTSPACLARARIGSAVATAITSAMAMPSNPDCFISNAPAPSAPAARSQRRRPTMRHRTAQATAPAAGTAAASSEFIVNPSMCGPTPTIANTNAAIAPVAGPRTIQPIAPMLNVRLTPASAAAALIAQAWYATSVIAR